MPTQVVSDVTPQPGWQNPGLGPGGRVLAAQPELPDWQPTTMDSLLPWTTRRGLADSLRMDFSEEQDAYGQRFLDALGEEGCREPLRVLRRSEGERALR